MIKLIQFFSQDAFINGKLFSEREPNLIMITAMALLLNIPYDAKSAEL
jgi:hypothetical protein